MCADARCYKAIKTDWSHRDTELTALSMSSFSNVEPHCKHSGLQSSFVAAEVFVAFTVTETSGGDRYSTQV